MLEGTTAPLSCRGIKVRRRRFTLDLPSIDIEHGLTLLGGMNGAGKSTLLACLLAGEGRRMKELVWQGVSVTGRDEVARFRRQLGYVPQEKVLPQAWRVAEYLSFVARTRGIGARQIGQKVETASAILSLDPALLDRQIGSLSGGWQRRVHITQALIGEPEIMLFDEPFNALDYQAVDLLREYVAARVQAPDQIVVVADHTAGLAAIPHQKLSLADGRLV